MIENFKKKAYELFLEWEKNYRKESKECDYEALDWVYCPEGAREDKKKYRKDIRAALKGQIEFIKYHVGLMTLPGPTNNNLNRINQFLSMQHLIDKYFPDGEKPPITLTFWGGSPVCARVYVEELSNIDFEDSYDYLYFQTISISNANFKTWTQKKIRDVIQHIKEDMEFDGDEVEIELEDNWGVNKPGADEISLCCGVKEFDED
jgi:hypothetical protein